MPDDSIDKQICEAIASALEGILVDHESSESEFSCRIKSEKITSTAIKETIELNNQLIDAMQKYDTLLPLHLKVHRILPKEAVFTFKKDKDWKDYENRKLEE